MSIDKIRTAVETAASQWTGLSWESALGPMANALTKAVACAKRRDAMDEGDYEGTARAEMRRALWSAREATGAAWWPKDGSYSSQCLDRRLRDLEREIEALDDDSSVETIQAALDEAESLAVEEREHVEARAAQAAEYGAICVECAESGDWDGAIEAAQDACRTEREFGDSPAWSDVLRLVRECAPTSEEE